MNDQVTHDFRNRQGSTATDRERVDRRDAGYPVCRFQFSLLSSLGNGDQAVLLRKLTAGNHLLADTRDERHLLRSRR